MSYKNSCSQTSPIGMHSVPILSPRQVTFLWKLCQCLHTLNKAMSQLLVLYHLFWISHLL